MAKESAGLLLYRQADQEIQFLLVHPGGPFWMNKDLGAWTIPKGEIQPGEPPLAAAIREFTEELGTEPNGHFVQLTPVRQKAGKLIRAWAFESDWDPVRLRSNVFTMEWPPRSGRMQRFPEVDRAAFFGFQIARDKINSAQVSLLEQVLQLAKASER